MQTSANNSTWYCYLKITLKSGNIQSWIPGQIGGNYSPWVIFEFQLLKLAFTSYIPTYFIILERFLLFSTMHTHAQACVRWSKYTSIELQLNLGHRVLIFTSKTNLESGPWFAKIWSFGIWFDGELKLNDIFAVFSYLCFILSTLRRWDYSAAIQELFSFREIGTKQPLLYKRKQVLNIKFKLSDKTQFVAQKMSVIWITGNWFIKLITQRCFLNFQKITENVTNFLGMTIE